MRRTANDRPVSHLDVDRSPLGLAFVHRLLEIDAVEGVRRAIVEGVELLASASFVRLWEKDGDVFTDSARRGVEPEPAAVELERRLVELRGPSRSTLERHGDPEIDRLSHWYRSEARLCHVRPLRAFGTLVGAVALHCFDRAELMFGELEVLRRYADSASVALRNAYVREELRRLAYTDPLTGLANRRAIEDLLAHNRHRLYSVLFVDFDGLKNVNDIVGYESGDAVIKAVGDALRQPRAPTGFPAASAATSSWSSSQVPTPIVPVPKRNYSPHASRTSKYPPRRYPTSVGRVSAGQPQHLTKTTTHSSVERPPR